MYRVATGIHEPTQSTTHQARTMLPFQNHLILRRAFTAIENAFNEFFGLPKSRRKKRRKTQ
jgi:hypothetical protein